MRPDFIYDCTHRFVPFAYLFTGKERDTESGLDYFGARYYSSNMGRFSSPDSSDDPDPIPFARLDEPQTLNLYAYGVGNPITNADGDGHSVTICDNNGQCNNVSNAAYQAAQQGNNGGLNVPTLDQVGSNGNGNGQFNATAITDSNGNTVGTATYHSDGGADYYANSSGLNLAGNIGAVMNRPSTYAAWYGASALGGALLYAGGATAGGELISMGNPVTASNLASKLNYLFGAAQGADNAARTGSLALALKAIGLWDNPENREYVAEKINEAVNDASSIANSSDPRGGVIRDVFLQGPIGSLKLQVVMQGTKVITFYTKN